VETVWVRDTEFQPHGSAADNAETLVQRVQVLVLGENGDPQPSAEDRAILGILVVDKSEAVYACKQDGSSARYCMQSSELDTQNTIRVRRLYYSFDYCEHSVGEKCEYSEETGPWTEKPCRQIGAKQLRGPAVRLP
jgi:hypothetical protein